MTSKKYSSTSKEKATSCKAGGFSTIIKLLKKFKLEFEL